ncbi:hypothetical protein PVIIG_04311 [Plasmodium vivax India VII]|uniref:SAM domain-containing protein n=1 Tax=Plasmodium vivax India VII TaxID=1077284 RepID=A0A0J9SCY9_PLAVI|nr:hypothetical protein PVIIG_04311 [Plasmodium vivax India VII]
MGNSPDSKPIRGRDFRGYRYIGELNDEREPNGKGLILHNSGEAFYGSFSNGKKNGIGIYINNKLTKYICNWVNDTVDGELKVKPFHAEKVFSFFYSNGVIHSCRVYRGGPKSERGLDEEQSRGTPKGGGEPQSVNIRNKLDGEGVSFIPVSQPGYFFPAGRIHHGRTAGPGSDHREDAIESSHDEANIPADELNKKRIDEPLKGDDTWKDIFYTSSDSCSHLIGAHFIKMGGKKKCHRDARLGGTTRKDLSIVTHTLAKKEERKTKHMIKRLTKQNSNSLRIDKYESWSRREVAQWLSLCNTPIKWITSFYRNNITGDMLDRMNIEIVRNQMGILPYGHAIKLLQLIKNLRVMAYNKRFARCVNIQECEHFLRRRKKKKKKYAQGVPPEGRRCTGFTPRRDEAYGSCSLSSFSITSTSSQSSGPDLSSEDSGESNGTSVPTCEEKPKGGDNSIRASSAELEISAASTSSSSASATLDTSPHASTSSVSSSSYCSNRTDDAPFYGRSQIIKYPSNIYLNSNLAFSYLYSFIIPHEELTFLHLIRSHYEIRTCRGKLARKKRGQGQWQNRGQWQSLPPTNSEPKKPNPMRGDLQNGKVMRSRTFRGKYLGKDVAIKVLVGRVKDFSQIHKIFYKLHLLRHGNIALMMGVSIRYPFVFIIYEFLKNACLFSYLHCAGGYAKDLSGRQREGGVRTPLGSASSISRGGGISAHGSPGNSSTCDSSPGGTSPSDNPTFESHSGRIATRMRNKCNSFVLENDLFCGVYAEEGEEGKEAEEAEQHGGATSGESPPLPANKLNASVKSPPKEWNTHQGKSKAHIEKINKKRGKKKKKLHTKLFLQDQIQLHEPDVTLACSYLEKHLSHPLNLKPTNILLDEALNAKITDFGICEIEKCLDTHVDHSYVVYANGVTTFDAALADRKVHRMEFSRNAFNDVPLSDVPLSDVLRVYDDEDKLHLYSTERIVASPSSAYPSVSFWTPPEVSEIKKMKKKSENKRDSSYSDVPFNYPFKSHLVASVGYANEELTYDDIPEPIQGLIKLCVHRNMYKRPTFGHILAVLSRLYEKANTKCEDALMSFMDGT